MTESTMHQRLTEAELDEAIRSTQEHCDHRCAQGRNHACPAPEVEWPPLTVRTFGIALVMVIAVVCVSVMVQA